MAVMQLPQWLARFNRYVTNPIQRMWAGWAAAPGVAADEVIAECVGVDPEALPTFMRVAEAKLTAATEAPPT